MKKSFAVTVVCLCSLLFLFSAFAAAEVTVKPYGYVLFNVNANTDSVYPMDIPVIATQSDEEGTLDMFARQTRLGLVVKSKGELSDVDFYAKVEMDFWGLRSDLETNATNNTAPRLRLAYGQLDWGRTQFTFGQDWMMTFAPLNPTSLAHVSVVPFSTSGNLWTRIPQLRIDHRFRDSGRTSIKLSGAMLRPFGADYGYEITQIDYPGSGELSKMPFFQGRVAVVSGDKGKKCGMLETGVGFHYGHEKSTYDEDENLKTYGIAWDGLFPIDPVTVSGEFFWGKNLNMFYSLASVRDRGYRSETEQETMGGWIQLSGQVSDKVQLNGGYGVENVDDDDIYTGDITQNNTVFGNIIYSISRNFNISFETGYIKTEYKGEDDENNVSFNFAFQYIFK